MNGQRLASTRHIIGSLLAGGLLVGTLPASVGAAADSAAELPSCSDLAASVGDGGIVTKPWEAVLDADGALTGHRLTLRHAGSERTLRTRRRGFSLELPGGRVVVGERSGDGTRVDLLDPARGCLVWSRQLSRMAYPSSTRGDGRIRLNVHDPATREYQATLSLDPETGSTEGAVSESCVDACLPTDGGLTAAALLPATSSRPTPNFLAGAWAKDKTLSFRWKAGAVPPSWARSALQSAGDDAKRTSAARSPSFPLRGDGANAVAYTASLPGFCSVNAIACARRSMPTFWGVWIRPHGTDFAWGPLRWCQKTSANSGCLDIRRVMLHELGHVIGLDHPSSAGFTLTSNDSIMQGITPSRPNAGASRHSWGRCDVATLQELYDTTDNKTPISTCNDVATKVTLAVSRSSVKRGSSVSFTSQLKVDARSAYRQLSGNPLNGRTLKLKYRKAGSNNPWRTAWMRSLYSSGRYELSISPGATWEFKAVFPTPANEGLRYSRSQVVKVKVRR